ncbi:MAG: TetR family transcriptional regulator C-terminal domain-containing protein, partial [Acidobacteria bacterium]|nr:TetR family transcriptional regulator C-terminal domain-containing protein [Acidobacteriota bacterium]
LAGEGAAMGCMMANCSAELAARDEEVRERVRAGLARAEAAFEAALEKARTAGDLPAGRDVEDLARFFVMASNGMAVVGKARPGRKFLERCAGVILSVLD